MPHNARQRTILFPGKCRLALFCVAVIAESGFSQNVSLSEHQYENLCEKIKQVVYEEYVTRVYRSSSDFKAFEKRLMGILNKEFGIQCRTIRQLSSRHFEPRGEIFHAGWNRNKLSATLASIKEKTQISVPAHEAKMLNPKGRSITYTQFILCDPLFTIFKDQVNGDGVIRSWQNRKRTFHDLTAMRQSAHHFREFLRKGKNGRLGPVGRARYRLCREDWGDLVSEIPKEEFIEQFAQAQVAMEATHERYHVITRKMRRPLYVDEKLADLYMLWKGPYKKTSLAAIVGLAHDARPWPPSVEIVKSLTSFAWRNGITHVGTFADFWKLSNKQIKQFAATELGLPFHRRVYAGISPNRMEKRVPAPVSREAKGTFQIPQVDKRTLVEQQIAHYQSEVYRLTRERSRLAREIQAINNGNGKLALLEGKEYRCKHVGRLIASHQSFLARLHGDKADRQP